MALIELTMRSNALNTNTTVCVCFPEETGADRMRMLPKQYRDGVRYQTLWLLHGGGGDATNWPRYTSIERYANEHKLMVVCPSAYQSSYMDMYYGDAYETWIMKELPQVLQWMLPISPRREDNFVAGLSMGGYGALKWAVNEPERFACAGSFSGAVDMPAILRRNHLHDGALDEPMELIFGSVERVEHTHSDVIWMAQQQCAAGVQLPKFYVTVGTEDFTYDFNINLREAFAAEGLDLTWDERPGGHTWGYWDAAVQRFINWLPLRNAPVEPAGKEA